MEQSTLTNMAIVSLIASHIERTQLPERLAQVVDQHQVEVDIHYTFTPPSYFIVLEVNSNKWLQSTLEEALNKVVNRFYECEVQFSKVYSFDIWSFYINNGNKEIDQETIYKIAQVIKIFV